MTTNSEQELQDVLSGLRVIMTAVRDDEKSSCWPIRKWLNDREIFNDDLQGSDRLIEEVCKHLLPEIRKNIK